MGSGFFRRPTDDSSSSDTDDSEPDTGVGENGVSQEAAENFTTESISSNGSISTGDIQDGVSAGYGAVDQHRNMLLSALLEDFVRNRACEEMNKAHPGRNFTRHSPEIQPLAQQLFQRASQPLALNGWITPSAAGENAASMQARATYLAGIENLALSNIQSDYLLQQTDQLPRRSTEQALAVTRQGNLVQSFAQGLQQSMASLSLHGRNGQAPSPYSDMIFSSPSPRPSHYESSFQQIRFLGRGGFGAVYHTHNLFDQKDYAVKKIPLSPRLSRRYRESGHRELENILREVQALAQLEHSNIVRYHATWIEDPKEESSNPGAYGPQKNPSLTVQGRRLLGAAVASPSGIDSLRHSPPRDIRAVDKSDDVVFELDSHAEALTHGHGSPSKKLASNSPLSAQPSENDSMTSSARPSEIFSDGNAVQRPTNLRDGIQDSSVYVLYVQMSVYPTTLAQHLAPTTTTDSHTGLDTAAGSGAKGIPRHCFHLIPALRILMGILCGLQYIHAKGLVHRDIKPSNVFLAGMDLASESLVPDGFFDVGTCTACGKHSPYFVNPRIGDFGLVAQLARDSDVDTPASKTVGTEYYRPPVFREARAKGRAAVVDEKLDVFAMGVILVELIWCCATRTERMHVLQGLQQGRLPVGLAAKVDAEGHQTGTGDQLVECIRGMIERDPSRRWGCGMVAQQVKALLDKACTSMVGVGSAGQEESPGMGETLSKITSIEDAGENEHFGDGGAV
ncbi:hypothetical protein B0A52_09572 [Exophiala mesophila]|uniref:Protein kinase domain-containing protein n=1 Tax=Exophiala mesophila TaxID=212818 RepID=A0A438MT30_EXOME|nr:hypothetical protein B0A52_09572 [Exophiala mesophila]